MEVILFVAPESTDLPLNGVAFMTEGVGDFMTSVMGIDNQDLLSKMEGFAIQGMKGMSCPLRHLADPHIPIGAAQNHQQCVSQVRAAIRQIINTKLHKSFSLSQLCPSSCFFL